MFNRQFESTSIDLDLGCLYEFTDGSKGVVQALGNSFAASPRGVGARVIWLDGDDRSGHRSRQRERTPFRVPHRKRTHRRRLVHGSTARRGTAHGLACRVRRGLGGPVLFPILPVLGQMFLTIVIGGMCTGAVVTSASHLPTILAFLLSASLPVAILFFCQGTLTGSALGAMVLVFVAALALAAVHFNRFLADTTRLRIELSRANLRLQAEIAERQATEAALRQAQKLEVIGQLTGGIAHDFNNLLTIVNGNLTLAMERIGENSAGMPLLRGALQAAERGGALIHRLLAFARKQRLDPKPVNLSHLVAGIEDLIRRTLGDRIGLAIASDPDLSPARVDANQLELAILNLTINARDAMSGGGSLRIELQNSRTGDRSPPELSPGDYVVVSISDTGTGMDEETLARAFEPFFTTKELGIGSGLGLPMVQGFAAQSGGAVRIRSELGGGTTVELWLPQADEPPLKTPVPSSDPARRTCRWTAAPPSPPPSS